MIRLLILARAIDRFNHRLGRLVSWLTLAMVVIASYNAVLRHVGRRVGMQLTSNGLVELQWYLFSSVFLLGAAYALAADAHVRVDVFYCRLGTRGRAWVNLIGTILFLLPFCACAMYWCWPAAANAWAVLEASSDAGGLPRYPIKTLPLVAFALLIFQGLSLAIHSLAILTGAESTGVSA